MRTTAGVTVVGMAIAGVLLVATEASPQIVDAGTQVNLTRANVVIRSGAWGLSLLSDGGQTVAETVCGSMPPDGFGRPAQYCIGLPQHAAGQCFTSQVDAGYAAMGL